LSRRTDPFTALIDTNVLVGALTRNLLLTLAEAGLFRARWSATTLNEFERAFVKLYGEAERDTAVIQRQRMEAAFPEARIEVRDHLINSLTLPDPDDRHILAAAIDARAGVIVTENTKDFPADRLVPHGIEAVRLDDFLADCIDRADAGAIAAIRRMRLRFQRPDIDADALIRRVDKLGLSETAKMLMAYKDIL
jgi:predicted nucleic acid-binding protein